MRRLVMCLAIAVALVAAGARASGTSTYTLVDLGTLGGKTSEAAGINDRGMIVGGSDTTSGARHAFLWQNGVMKDLGTVPGSEGFSTATALNARGDVVGTSSFGQGQHAVLWTSGKIVDLGTLGGDRSIASAINDAGDIAGWSTTLTGARHAVLWRNGTVVDLGTLAGARSYATAIDDRGRVFGGSETSSQANLFHAFVWENGAMSDLGLLAGNYSYARAVNARGQVAGDGETSAFEGHAVVWEDGGVRDLGLLPGTTAAGAYGINDNGLVIGMALTPPSRWHAFVWDGAINELSSLGGASSYALGVNNRGEIVGGSMDALGDMHAVLWTIPGLPPADPARPVFGAAKLVPATAVARRPATFTVPVTRSDTGDPFSGVLKCDPAVEGKLVKHAESFTAGTVRVRFTIPADGAGKQLRIKIRIDGGGQTATRVFMYRVARARTTR